MKITKEIDIDIEDFSDSDLISELEDRISYAGVLFTEEAQKRLEPKKDEMIATLMEISRFINYPGQYLAEQQK